MTAISTHVDLPQSDICRSSRATSLSASGTWLAWSLVALFGGMVFRALLDDDPAHRRQIEEPSRALEERKSAVWTSP